MATYCLGRAAARRIAAAIVVMAMSAPGSIARAAQSQLVHCGSETCLRLTGHRASAAIAVRIAGHDLAVEGGRSWHVTVPLSIARDWPSTADGMLRLTLSNPSSGTQTMDMAATPPGALGKHVELATLVVRAH